jgi:hypothetical protein
MEEIPGGAGISAGVRVVPLSRVRALIDPNAAIQTKIVNEIQAFGPSLVTDFPIRRSDFGPAETCLRRAR